jgi:hypothetical protein
MSQYSDRPVYHCRRIVAPIVIDGDTRKPVWREMPQIDLTLAQGAGVPQQKTTVRGCWDGAVLYLAFECEDMDIRATMTKRDSLVWQEEAVEAFIAPYGDLVHYFEFQCNPLNTVNDVRVTSPNARGVAATFDRAWICAGWQTATRKISDGWASEWAIPLSALESILKLDSKKKMAYFGTMVRPHYSCRGMPREPEKGKTAPSSRSPGNS